MNPSSANDRIPRYQPLLLALICFAFGIFVDYSFDVSIGIWGASCAIAWVCWAISFGCFRRRLFFTTILLLSSATLLGGAWHHVRWNFFGPAEISCFATHQFEPVIVRGIVIEEPQAKGEDKVDVFDNVTDGVRTAFELRVTELRQGKEWEAASGKAKVVVSGQLRGINVGDELLFPAAIVAARRPQNPGEFDFYQFGRRHGNMCLLAVSNPAAIAKVKQGRVGPFRFLATLRTRLNSALQKNLESDRSSLAAAILLGNRRQLDDQQFETFLVNGTMHILAISGLHVGILASAVLFLGHLQLISRQRVHVLTIILVVGYCCLVEFRPPVLRATVLITLFCLGKIYGRDGFSINLLSLAAMIVLALNPTDLFNTGAQLSFLAVASISFASRWIHLRSSIDPLDVLIEQSRPWFEKAMIRGFRLVRSAYVMSLVIWLVTMPLVAFRFNLVSPVGILVNPLLMIPLAAALYFGFMTLTLDFVFPSLARTTGFWCDFSLGTIQNLLEWSRTIPGSYFWTSGPELWSVYFYYGCLIVVFAFRSTRLPWRWLLTLFLAWLSFGWLLPSTIHSYQRATQEAVNATFIDVGHGTSVLVQLPNGQHILYDCGSFGSPEFGLRQISKTLWSKDVAHLDAVIISHADLDHFNCLPQLMQRFSIGCVYLTQPMVESRDPAVGALLDLLSASKIETRIICAEDQWMNGKVALEVLSPPQLGTAGNDNSNSVVLAVTVGETSMLLTGDLEGDGMTKLLETPRRSFDVVMAPHHGSNNSRPREFLEWSNPQTVVICGKSSRVNSNEYDEFDSRGLRVIRTEAEGAVTIEMSAEKQRVLRQSE